MLHCCDLSYNLLYNMLYDKSTTIRKPTESPQKQVIIIVITLFAERRQRNKNSELDSRAGQHGSKNKSYTDSCP